MVSPIRAFNASTTVEFKYHVVDEYLAENVLDGDGEVVTERDRRAKVVSTSDPQGEWVTISEVVGYGGSDTLPAPAATYTAAIYACPTTPARRGRGATGCGCRTTTP